MLTSRHNPLVKHFRKLHQGKGRRQAGQFLLEGTHLIQEALAAAYPLHTIAHTVAWGDRHPNLLPLLQQQAERIERVSPEVLAVMATTVHPDGIVATAPHREISHARLLPSLGLAVESLQDPGNLGTLIRTAAAVDVQGLWLSADSVDPENPKVLRASAGQWFRLPLEVCPNFYAQLDYWRQQGIQVLGTHPQADQHYWAVDWLRPTVILLGNEGQGLSTPVLERVSQQIRIPTAPAVESLNVAISAAVLLYEAKRQRYISTHTA